MYRSRKNPTARREPRHLRIPPQNIFSFTSPPPALESAQINPNGNIYSAIMITVTSYSAAIVMCFITMLCWGSWANTQKMVKGNWPFPLFYWDYSIGVLAFSLLLALTAGSLGSGGRRSCRISGRPSGSGSLRHLLAAPCSTSQTYCSWRQSKSRGSRSLSPSG